MIKAREILINWGIDQGYQVEEDQDKGIDFIKGNLKVRVFLEAIDIYSFVDRGNQIYDIVIAHAFLDLMDAKKALGDLFSIMKPGGLFYFTLNYDGMLVFEPVVNPDYQPRILNIFNCKRL